MSILVLCGKSASGKDTIASKLKSDYGYESIVSYTTRPMRVGEKDGVDYNYTTKEKFMEFIKEDKMVEYRSYNTKVNGVDDTWYYGLTKDSFDKLDSKKNYVVILDLDGLKALDTYLDHNLMSVYIDVSDDVRKSRAMSRGSFDETEWDRRCKDDAVKFANVNCSCEFTNENIDIDDLMKQIVYVVGGKNRLNDLESIDR